VAKVRREWHMGNEVKPGRLRWPDRKLIEGCSELVRIGGWYFPFVADERVWVGDEDFAVVWGCSKRSVQDWARGMRALEAHHLEYARDAEERRRIIRLYSRVMPREQIGGGSPQLVMPDSHAKQIYKEWVVIGKVHYAPATPNSGRKPGTKMWSRRLPLGERDERLLHEYERENAQFMLDYERFKTGNYANAGNEDS
jgi:hypothetical protein